MRVFLRNSAVIAGREYRARVRTRAFAILSLVVAALGLLFVVLPAGLRQASSGVETKLVVHAPGADGAALARLLEAVLNGPTYGADAGRFRVSPVDDLETGREQVLEGSIEGLVTISRQGSGELGVVYETRATAGARTTAFVRQATAALQVQDRLNRAGIDLQRQARIFAPTPFEQRSLGPAAPPPPDAAAARNILGFTLVILVFTAIVTYGYWIAQSIAEEKGSRVMELLVSAATPDQLLVGKVLGAAAAGLTQYLFLLAGAGGGIALRDGPGRDALGGGSPLTLAADPAILLAFGGYFLLGFLLYAGLYAAAGSLVSKQDATQVGTPISMVAMIGYMASTVAIGSPNVDWVRVASHLPVWSPFFMLGRLVQGAVEPAELAVSVALLVVTTLVIFWLASRVYRAGVLMYGQKPGLRLLVRLLATG